MVLTTFDLGFFHLDKIIKIFIYNSVDQIIGLDTLILSSFLCTSKFSMFLFLSSFFKRCLLRLLLEKDKYIYGLITTYPPMVWSKFKLSVYDLKFDNLPA